VLRTFEIRAVAERASAPKLLLSAPHRAFFLAGVVQIAAISLWWLWVLAARYWAALPAPGAAMPDTIVHALLMTSGFTPLFMFGFLFTAGPR